MSPSSQAAQSPSPPTTFTRFPSLPTELRVKIWNESFQPRVVELHSQQSGNESPKWVSNCSNPAALSVCSEARELALAHYYLLLPVLRSKPGPPLSRTLYFDPNSDLLAILGEVEFVRLFLLHKTIRMLDPAGKGARRFCLSISFWSHCLQLGTLRSWNVTFFSQLEELVLLMYDEQRPPANFLDGECAVEAVEGMDAFSRVINWMRLYEFGQLRIMNLKFIPGPVSRRIAR
ncbi:hypothetical protein F4804DRAFT_282111 [Jackrogersella minutella]|nr:hypothetical protein F4804DRAFT_282111 [Jackrogersella minutella]